MIQIYDVKKYIDNDQLDSLFKNNDPFKITQVVYIHFNVHEKKAILYFKDKHDFVTRLLDELRPFKYEYKESVFFQLTILCRNVALFQNYVYKDYLKENFDLYNFFGIIDTLGIKDKTLMYDTVRILLNAYTYNHLPKMNNRRTEFIEFLTLVVNTIQNDTRVDDGDYIRFFNLFVTADIEKYQHKAFNKGKIFVEKIRLNKNITEETKFKMVRQYQDAILSFLKREDSKDDLTDSALSLGWLPVKHDFMVTLIFPFSEEYIDQNIDKFKELFGDYIFSVLFLMPLSNNFIMKYKDELVNHEFNQGPKKKAFFFSKNVNRENIGDFEEMLDDKNVVKEYSDVVTVDVLKKLFKKDDILRKPVQSGTRMIPLYNYLLGTTLFEYDAIIYLAENINIQISKFALEVYPSTKEFLTKFNKANGSRYKTPKKVNIYHFCHLKGLNIAYITKWQKYFSKEDLLYIINNAFAVKDARFTKRLRQAKLLLGD
jgi:hypothetical protein